MREHPGPTVLQVFSFVLYALYAAGAGAGEFVVTGSMAHGRDFGFAVPLPGGQILVLGGVSADGTEASAERYDPATGIFTATGALAEARDGDATVTPLIDGSVLVAGGTYRDADGTTQHLASAERYDPASGTFTSTGAMHTTRYFHSAARLADGRVLIAGGWVSPEAGRTASAEIYDPASGRFTPTGDLQTARNGQIAITLPNGRVLIIGGVNTDASGVLASVESYDPASGQFQNAGTLHYPRLLGQATLLRDGRVLVAGGVTNDALPPTAELYDPATATSQTVGDLTRPRSDHMQALLPDGRVLVVGGLAEAEEVLASAELFDPSTGLFTSAGEMHERRSRAAITALADGRVLVAGGYQPGWVPPASSAEVYVPDLVDRVFGDGFDTN